MNSLVRKLLRCWEIYERFREEFNTAVAGYQPAQRGQAAEIPQLLRLEEEFHNFLYEAKNYIRDLLKVVNLLYATNFKEASEFSRPKKGQLSLLEWASKTFGDDDPKTVFLTEARARMELLIDARNAVEHPGGYSGTLHIQNFTLEADGKLAEAEWHREKDGAMIEDVVSVRDTMEVAIHNLLLLGEDILGSWAADHLKMPKVTRIAAVPEDRRDPKCPAATGDAKSSS